MEENLASFRDGVIKRSIEEFGGRDPEAGFGVVAGELLEDAEELTDFVASPYRGMGTRRRSLGIDGYAFDEVDGSLRLVIVEFKGDKLPVTLTQTMAKTIFGRVIAFVDEA